MNRPNTVLYAVAVVAGAVLLAAALAAASAHGKRRALRRWPAETEVA